MKDRSRLERLLRLTSLLQSGRLFNADALSTQLRVSRRTVFRDLQTLNNAGLSVLFDDARDGYFLPSPWKLPIEPLTAAEAVSLLLVCHEVGGQLGGIPMHSAARSAANKISQGLPPALQEFSQEAVEAMTIHMPPVASLEQSSRHYEQLLEAWMQRRRVRLEYDSASEQKRIATILSPYRLLFSRRSWYVIGYSSRDRAVRTYNIGRIFSLSLLESDYQIPKRFRLERYLGDAWHLIREPKERHRIVIYFEQLVARNVAEVAWHRTQQCRWLDDGRLEFSVVVEGLREIAWWILGYGEQAEVIEPVQLRELLQEKIRRMSVVYGI